MSSVQLIRNIIAKLNLRILYALIITISLSGACNILNNKSRDIDLLDASKITEIRIRVLDVKISGDKLFKTIHTSSEISNLVEFANVHVLAKSNLESNIDKIMSIQDRSTQVNIAFYESEKYLGNLGLGRYGNDKYFIKYRQYSESKVAVISNEQKKKLLEAIGYSESEFDQN